MTTQTTHRASVNYATDAPANKPSLSYEDAGVTKIAIGDNTIHHGPLGQPANVTYAFFGDPGLPYDKSQGWTLREGEQERFNPANAKIKATVEQAMKSWTDVAGITFTPATDPDKADIKFGEVTNPKIDSETITTLGGVTSWKNGSAEIWTRMQDKTHPDGRTPGSYNTQTYTHEIGHALGLSHPGQYGSGDATYARNAEYAEDTRGYTVMSYFSEHDTGQDFQGFSAEGPLLHDISAIQHLYGANADTRPGDTTYGFNANTDRADMRATSPDDKLVFSVWDAGGHNTFDFSGYKQDQKIDLRELAFSDVGGLKGNVSIAKGTHIDDVIGGHGNDVLIGNDDDNVIVGNEGNNLIYGGKGSDLMIGGAGHNTYLFDQPDDSTVDDPDYIADFKTGQDKLDLQGLFGNHNPLVHHDGKGQVATKGAVSLFPDEDDWGYDGEGQQDTCVAVTLDGHSHPDMMIKVAGAVAMSDILMGEGHQAVA